MKKFLIFLVIVAAGYLVYDNFIKEKEVLKVEGNFIRIKEGVDIDAPAIQPRSWGHIEGKVMNVSESDVKNVVVTYKIGGDVSEAKIDLIKSGETKDFKTNQVMLRVMEPAHYFESVTFDDQQ